MGVSSISFVLVSVLSLQSCNGLGYYDYFAPGGDIEVGLVAEGESFTLNNKELMLFSGSFHYFRIHPDYWRDTLRKFRAAGLNALETYVPWNLHEPQRGMYDFGDLGEDMSDFLQIRKFIQLAKEEDIFVILRPGPYICSEWEMGGMPSWLLRDDAMKVRTYYDGFVEPVQNYFNALLSHLVDLQFTRGGSIVALQIENEYSGFGTAKQGLGKQYMEFLRDTFTANGFDESLYVTSDSRIIALGDRGAVEGALMTANFNKLPEENLAKLESLQPDRPAMVMEFWTTGLSAYGSDEEPSMGDTLEIVFQHNSSVNMYMFIGGTSFGFMAGGHVLPYWPYLDSFIPNYDWNHPLSEAGDYRDKYTVAKTVIAKYNDLEGVVDHPDQPPEREKIAYPSVAVEDTLDFATLLSQQIKITTDEGPMSMEHLPINDDNGQSYGYIVYTTHAAISDNSSLFITGHVRDMAQVLVDGKVMTKPYTEKDDVSTFGFWHGKDKTLFVSGTGDVVEINIMVENVCRPNFGTSDNFLHSKKGLWEGPILIDGEQIDQWEISPMEFKGKQIRNLTGWEPFSETLDTPAMYRSTFEITETPTDTFLNMSGWNKGVVFINGFNVGTYWIVQTTRFLYVPGPLLHTGINEIIAFEQYAPGPEFVFSATP